VTAPHTPVPFSNALEDMYIPDAQRVVNASRRDRCLVDR
jgi:Pyruvate/2-oxoglutarate dehydrogenase complex, dehydrogenase (E1) component, eukaryotic type, beta subunit